MPAFTMPSLNQEPKGVPGTFVGLGRVGAHRAALCQSKGLWGSLRISWPPNFIPPILQGKEDENLGFDMPPSWVEPIQISQEGRC